MQIRILPLLILGIVTFVAIFILRGKPREISALETDSESPTLATPSTDPRTQRLSQASGLLKKTLRHDAQQVQLDISVHIPKRCGPGDLDAIKLEMDHSQVKTILLTLETLSADDSSFAPLVQPVSLGDLQTGFSHQFRLARPRKALSLGLFLCKDSAGEGRCNTKPIVDMNKVFDTYYAASPRPGYSAEDKVYYFQYVQLNADDTIEVFGNGQPGKENLTALSQYLPLADPSRSAQEVDRSVNKISHLNQAIASLPIKLGSTLRMDLPVFDLNVCPREAARD